MSLNVIYLKRKVSSRTEAVTPSAPGNDRQASELCEGAGGSNRALWKLE